MTRGALMVRATRKLQGYARHLTEERTSILALLEAIPWVRTRVECQRLLEQRPPGAEPVRGC
jgi:hypothetical protein